MSDRVAAGPAQAMPARRLPTIGAHSWQTLAAAAILLAACLGPDLAGDDYWAGVLQLVALFVAASTFMGVLYVEAGQVSLGHGAVFGVGAYVVGIASGVYGLPLWAGMALGTVGGMALSLLFALPALRVQGFYLGFVTLSVAMVLPDMALTLDRYTRGVNGIPFIDLALGEPVLGPVTLQSALCALVALLAVGLQWWLPRTRLGRMMRVAAGSTEAARSLGARPALLRAVAFLLAGAGTGLAGSLYGPVVGFVSPSAFGVDLSILFFFAVVVGGKGQPLAAVVGVGLLYLVPNVLFAGFADLRTLLYGGVALLVMLLCPDGIVGTAGRLLRRVRPNPGNQPPLAIGALLDGVAARQSGGDAVAVAVQDARKSFGKVAALDGVSMEVRRGEVHALIGANGSGKTSLLNVLSGFTRLSGGTVTILGSDAGRSSPGAIARRGVGRTFQTPRIFPGLSLWDNLRIGLDGRTGPACVPPAIVASLRSATAGRPVAGVPFGQRRLLEVARVVLKGADLLLLDEPAAGLSPSERRHFAALVRRLAGTGGCAVLLVEHDLDLVWGVADRITVLETGRVVASGSPAEIAHIPAVRALFVGAALPEAAVA